ncbi:MAG: glycosyl hydrolase family 28-related protein, partial [bacterium]|nr:glycosyl hydrolase family 28-related protein [bacterium]
MRSFALVFACLAGFLCPDASAQTPLVLLTDCESLAGWGSSAKLAPDSPEGARAVSASMPSGTGFLSFDFQSTRIDLSTQFSLSFWWKAEGDGLQDLKIKVRNYPLVNGMEAIYTIWGGQTTPQGWQLATVTLAKPQFDDWGGPPDHSRRYITFRTVTAANSAIALFVDHIVAAREVFHFELGAPIASASPITAFDFDGDQAVGFGDFILFAQHFGTSKGETLFETRYDLNGDGQVGFGDFISFSQNFGSDGSAWSLPVTVTNVTSEVVTLSIGSGTTSFGSPTVAPGNQTLQMPLPRALVADRNPSETFALPVWVQVSDFTQTRQASVAYVPQSGKSATFRQFEEAVGAGTEPILPDFSYAGYHYFAEPVPEVQAKLFDVTQFGAVADDGLSDQVAIQRAIDEAERNLGGIVFFPPGEFLVNGDADRNQIITIRSSRIVLRGSGSRMGGTIIRQVNHMPPTNPDQLWTSPYMVKFQPPNTSDAVLGKITANARRESFWITVDDASRIR